jgi:hypothetical protein
VDMGHGHLDFNLFPNRFQESIFHPLTRLQIPAMEEGGPNWSGWRTVDASWFKGWRTLRTPTGPEDVVTSYMKNGKIKILFEYLYRWQIKI